MLPPLGEPQQQPLPPPEQQQQAVLPPHNGGVDGMHHAAQQHAPVSQPLQLTQLLGSEVDNGVMLHPPKPNIIARAKMPRGDRLVSSRRRGARACAVSFV
jgi:hypothetical protein